MKTKRYIVGINNIKFEKNHKLNQIDSKILHVKILISKFFNFSKRYIAKY